VVVPQPTFRENKPTLFETNPRLSGSAHEVETDQLISIGERRSTPRIPERTGSAAPRKRPFSLRFSKCPFGFYKATRKAVKKIIASFLILLQLS
jgi:hypothetical protein